MKWLIRSLYLWQARLRARLNARQDVLATIEGLGLILWTFIVLLLALIVDGASALARLLWRLTR